MRKLYALIGLAAISAIVAIGATFTDVDSPQYHGWQELNAAVDANNALLENGSLVVAATIAIATNAYSYTPTTPVQLLNATVADTTVTLAVASTSVPQYVQVVNIGTGNVVLVNSGHVNGTASTFTNGQWDSWSFAVSGTNWVQTAYQDND